MRLSNAVAAAGLAMLVISTASTGTEAVDPDYEAARDTIWAKEIAIYEGRGNGDFGPYLNSTSEAYKGWPPGAKVPADLSGLRNMAGAVTGRDKEELTMELADFTMSGDTAVIYYHTHRTVLPTGEAVDQRYAICHVWVREDGEWRLIGALGRLKSEEEIR